MEKKIEEKKVDKKDEIIANAGYWDVPKNVSKKKQEYDRKYEESLKKFMRLHEKQISEILRKW